MSQYRTSPRKTETTMSSSPSRSSPKRRGSPTKSKLSNKEIKFNYYDPHAYDDPNQFYQWHKEKVTQDLCGKARERGFSQFESSYMTDINMSPYTGGYPHQNDLYDQT